MSVIDLSALTGGLKSLPPLSLYIHFPWCVRKCPYCDFNSHEAKAGFDEAGYVDALLADLELALPAVWGRPVTTIFMGGGTPSLFSPEAIDHLLAGVRARVRVHPDAEISMEANPGTVEHGRFEGYRAAGVNRLSLGIQSFDDGFLRTLGRIHGGAEARGALEAALQHFDNVNADLMYALPGQTLDQALADVDTALSAGVTHLSAYHLTIEPNTLFARYEPENLPDDERSADMQEAIEERLAAAGFQHYETSAFARPGRQCRHNLNYWTFGDYLGIGAGAHGKVSAHDGVRRQMRYKQPAAYLKAVAAGEPVQEAHKVGRRDLPFEFMMNALRLTGGFDESLFAAHTGLPLVQIARELDEAVRRGLIERQGGLIRPTLAGQRFLNDLLTLFLNDKA
ncbi:radical SAM family heme chaperone HemW [Crenobacter caeni]|uniref:Heme chaperone HemW n=1 Tax=Crenobacter caeni TaxID=2705474 RepID=A0A6B2KQ11_9NEIS|nr:radical SAM family heme chaperone HemW [Crenobacter caeni]NDV11977.1 oxygen-independent coproporphyrinogen III oxidase-like protein [Crenobacter caeni]